MEEYLIKTATMIITTVFLVLEKEWFQHPVLAHSGAGEKETVHINVCRNKVCLLLCLYFFIQCMYSCLDHVRDPFLTLFDTFVSFVSGPFLSHLFLFYFWVVLTFPTC